MKIDKVPRPDGDIPRIEKVRLAQLVTVQGDLAGRTNELEEALAAAGSVVYVWANKDIVGSMNVVKEDLAKPTTGVPTQAEQVRIVEQLDAMIRNLAVKPPEPRRFEQRGGGGGGQCKPGERLPTEAELRLLKDLQQAINKSTKTIDAQPEKDKPKLLALGGRQGELRNILDQLLQKASQGEMKLGPEPDPKDQLPEEAGKEAVENQELDDDLLNEEPDAEKIAKNTNRIGDRMARSRQRLAEKADPGKVTQLIQDRILIDLDDLIAQARAQQQQITSTQQPRPGQPRPQPRPGEEARANNEGQRPGMPRPNQGRNPAAQSGAPGEAATQTDLSQEIAQSEAEWGRLSPKARQAVIEGQREQPIEKYRKLIEDYYRGVATRQTERQ